MKYKKRLLAKYPILKRFPNAISELEKLDVNRSFEAGTIIKYSHDACIGFPFLLVGKLSVSKINNKREETFLFYLNPGDICHHAFRCILEDDSLGIQVKCVENSELIVMPILFFTQNFLKSERFYRYLYNDLFKKFDKLVDTKELLVHKSVEDRLLQFLEQNKGKTVKITQTQLATELSTVREVVSRALKVYEQQGKITHTRGYIEIHDNISD